MKTKPNTFILFWNPDISSYTLERLVHDLDYEICNEEAGFNWSVWEHEKAHEGDKFFMVRCKKAPVEGKIYPDGKQVWEPVFDETCGICMYGEFISEPYQGEDWSGKGRQTFYMDMLLKFIVNPDKIKMVTVAELMEKIPGFDWTGGHSGRLIDDDKVQALKNLVSDWFTANEKTFLGNDEDTAYYTKASFKEIASEMKL